jgi:hypothetical protein
MGFVVFSLYQDFTLCRERAGSRLFLSQMTAFVNKIVDFEAEKANK